MSKRIFFNLRTNRGVETVDWLSRNDFNSLAEYKQEIKRLRNEYHIAGMQVYLSNKATKDWYLQHLHMTN